MKGYYEMKYTKSNDTYIVRMFKGEEITQSLLQLSGREKITTAHVSGIGGVCDIELGFFDLEKKDYDHQKFNGLYELLNLSGNITLVDGSPFLHAHVTLGDSSYRTIGGHLFKATISVTGEFFVTPLDIEVSRNYDAETQLKLMDL